MPDCIFCKIVRGEVPSTKVYEDDEFIAFLGIPPVSPGYTLIVPRKHHRWVWDVPNAGAYFEVAAKIARAIKKSFGTELVQSKIVGEDVPHAHIWVFPDPATAQGDKEDLLGNAEKIKTALS